MPPKKSDIPFPKPAKNCVPPPSVLFLTPEPLLFLGFFVPPVSIFGDLFAHTIANDEPHKLNADFNINRFISGDLVDEHGAAAVAH